MIRVIKQTARFLLLCWKVTYSFSRNQPSSHATFREGNAEADDLTASLTAPRAEMGYNPELGMSTAVRAQL